MKTYKKLSCKNCRISNCPLQDIEVTDENKESDIISALFFIYSDKAVCNLMDDNKALLYAENPNIIDN